MVPTFVLTLISLHVIMGATFLGAIHYRVPINDNEWASATTLRT